MSRRARGDSRARTASDASATHHSPVDVHLAGTLRIRVGDRHERAAAVVVSSQARCRALVVRGESAHVEMERIDEVLFSSDATGMPFIEVRGDEAAVTLYPERVAAREWYHALLCVRLLGESKSSSVWREKLFGVVRVNAAAQRDAARRASSQYKLTVLLVLLVGAEAMRGAIGVSTTDKYYVWYAIAVVATLAIGVAFSMYSRPVTDVVADVVAAVESDEVYLPASAPTTAYSRSPHKMRTAGGTLAECDVPEETGDGDESTSAYVKQKPDTWCRTDARKVFVRAPPNFSKNAKKAPSGSALFDCIEMDVFYDETIIENIAKHVRLPCPSNASVFPPWLPHVWVFNFCAPIAGTPVFADVDDEPVIAGPGHSLVGYFTPSKELLSIAQAMERDVNFRCDDNAAHMLCVYFKEQRRVPLKLVCSLLNTESAQIPAWILGFNKKPCMLDDCAVVKWNGAQKRHKKSEPKSMVRYVEVDVDLRKWRLLSRQALNALLPKLHKLDIVASILLEGESDDELPERVAASCRLSFVKLKKNFFGDEVQKRS